MLEHQFAELIAAHLEIAVLVERGASRRQQHDRLGDIGRLGVGGSQLDRPLERAGNYMGHASRELGGEVGRGLTDQVGLAHAREEARERGNAPGLGLAARDPENVGEAGERLCGGIRVGCLGIIDEQHAVLAADLFHAVGEARKRNQALLDRLNRKPERERRAGGTGCVLRVVHAAQRADAADMGNGALGTVHGLHDRFALHVKPRAQRLAHGDASELFARPLDAVSRRRAPRIVDADDRDAVRLHAGDQPLLHRGVVRERPVAVEMVLADVEKNTDRRIERGRKVDLIGRALDHVRARLLRRRQREDGGADIAADLRVAAGRAQEMRNQRRGGRFAVGAGDGDERRVRCARPPFAAEQLDVADHLDGGGAGERRGPMRGGMRERDARREHERGNSRPVHLPQVGSRDAGARRLEHGVCVIVPADDVGAACEQRARTRQSRPAQAEDGDLLSGKDGDGDHHRSLSVDSPTSASTTATIQKRITICGSVQPSCSKWWWIGAMRNTRLPVSLNDMTCTITDTASSTNSPPTMPRTISCLVATAIAPSMPPSASEPVSPMKTEAGGALNQRKPSPAPITAPHTTASSPVPGTKWSCRYSERTPLPTTQAKMPKQPAAIITGTMASPSRPSVRFTALPAPTMMNAPNTMKNQPSGSTSSLKKGKVSEDANGWRPSDTMK